MNDLNKSKKAPEKPLKFNADRQSAIQCKNYTEYKVNLEQKVKL